MTFKEKRICGFIRNEFDKFILYRNRDNHIVFNHWNICENQLLLRQYDNKHKPVYFAACKHLRKVALVTVESKIKL